MLELIKEKNVWDALKEDSKPVAVYGMGLGAEKIINVLGSYGIEVCDIFASDEFVRGHSFLGYKVLKYSEICAKYEDFNVVLAFATHLDGVIDNIRRINGEHTVFAPDVPVAGGGIFTREFVEENEADFDLVYNSLADDESRRIYADIINFKISGKIDYLLNSFTADKNEIYRDILCLGDNEAIVDLGAYDGDTIREFTEFTGGKYRSITALEPDAKNYRKLLKSTEKMKNVTAYNMGAWDKRDTLIFSEKAGRNSRLSAHGVSVEVTDLDSLIDSPVTLIKMDIEGAELKALCGAESIIKKYSPKLYVCAYHRNEDLFTLGKKILELNPDYKLYFRHSKYIPAWESNFYAVI
jgi:FkbM family methyltransferase